MESHKVSEKEAKQIILETDKRYHKRHMALTEVIEETDITEIS